MGTPEPPPDGTVTVDVRGLWAGGAATAAVAALAGVVGVLIIDGVLGVTMTPPPLIPVGGSLTAGYALTSAVLALLATALAHVLVLTTPRPASFFSWIAGLATVVGVALPLASSGSAAGRIATAVLDLVIGLCIISLVLSVLSRTTHRSLPAPWAGGPPPPRGPGGPQVSWPE